jgi:hypothetical protein
MPSNAAIVSAAVIARPRKLILPMIHPNPHGRAAQQRWIVPRPFGAPVGCDR